MFRCMVVISLSLITLALAAPVLAAGPFPYRPPAAATGIDPQAVTVVGEFQTHFLKLHENMYEIARHYDLGFWELARFHRQLDHFYLPKDQDMIIPTRWVLPPAPAGEGIVINVAELRDYLFFPKTGQVRTYPIGIGVFDYKTPFGRFRISSKAENPGWRIPAGLQAKYGMAYMPPGEENPVGTHWLGLTHYGMHGTHAPFGVGRLVSHGCIRHYNEDIKELFELVPVGTPVLIVYEPVKIGFLHGRVFVEVHQDVYQKIPNMLNHAMNLIESRQIGNRINWTRLLQALEEKNGAPVDITR
ncbi:L,D-transpeptidase [Desulfobacca acetoxidans]|uniref:ErfK/YbiS/YcfS/YnhG family protein n=1 Tax=Desulfobacca acetoxidans (strain ATCC 700848 / DSM 11109 / ASRB2) TaxID=880072 RepID=F2NDL0_DESAR|nr:L,D-transpeptidase family protein [Desulfobacca acetoxidans]AEB10286.1 ErfK/YbiS/YcfS/YnhG family protein [Desulfobacca acetoxidans DSM 11109]